MRILVAADGSPFTKRMLGYLAAHDEWLGNRHSYTVLTVVPPVPPRAAAVLSKDVLDSYYTDEADKVFGPIREFFAQKKDLKVEFIAAHGHAAETIAKTADEGKYDLLMLGSHGHGALGNLVMGSVATKVVAQCGVPVLLVR
jgi:nucleotide-binding universal stress UspA family protein